MGCASYLAEVQHLNEVGMEQYEKEEKANKADKVSSHEYVSISNENYYFMQEYLRNDKTPFSDGNLNSEITMVDNEECLIQFLPALNNEGYYYIKFPKNDFVWSVKDGISDDNSPIVLQNMNGSDSQLFSLPDGGSDNLYFIKSKLGEKYLYSSNGKLIINTPKEESTRYTFKWKLMAK